MSPLCLLTACACEARPGGICSVPSSVRTFAFEQVCASGSVLGRLQSRSQRCLRCLQQVPSLPCLTGLLGALSK